ncbi:MAG: DMT family transporter [Gemmobacter sp.]|jgi:drug/metabolite transporter (DMT)-like permease
MPPSPAPSGDRALLGALLMLAFCITAPLIDVTAKLATETVSAGVVTLGRFVVQALCMAPIVIFMGLGLGMGREVRVLVLARAGVSVLATVTFVGALSVMPIADALAIAFIDAFILLLLGRFWFGEVVGPRRIAASVVGFGGSLLVIQPAFANFGLVALLPVATAVTFALYMLITRGLSRRMHPVAMQFHTAWIAALMTAPLLWTLGGSGLPGLAPIRPEGIAWVWVVGVGLSASVSHMFITYALRLAPAATLAPLHYLEIAVAALFGYLVFDDFPDATTWAGIAVIISAGLYIIHRERLAERALRAEAPPPPPRDAPAGG